VPAEAARLSRADGVTVLRHPGTRVVALIPNLRFTSAQLRDAAVRRGLSSAIDRDRIVTSVYGGAATGVATPVSPAAPVFDAAISGMPAHDPEASRTAFLAAGWTESPDGWRPPDATEPIELELLVRDPSVDPLGGEVAELVAEDWRAVGLDVEVVSVGPRP
jgi:ABC-type transport system substrate-binding protein